MIEINNRKLIGVSAWTHMNLRHPIITYVLTTGFCAFTTIIAVPIWLFIFDNTIFLKTPNDCPVGILALYGLARITAIPLGLINAFVVAPIIAYPLTVGSKLYSPIVWHMVAFLAIGVVMACCWFFSQTSIGTTLDTLFAFMLLPIILMPFWVPPLVAGSLAHSYCKLILLKQVLSTKTNAQALSENFQAPGKKPCHVS